MIKKIPPLQKKMVLINVITILASIEIGHAQLNNVGAMYIADNTELYVASGQVSFGSGSGTSTTRTAVTNGKISIAEGTSFANTNNAYVDGYIKLYGATAKILPTGNAGIAAPLKLTPETNLTIEAAYLRTNPQTALGNTMASTLSQVSAANYWDVKGTTGNAAISLTWSNSNISEFNSFLSANLAELTIVAWDGSKWVVIPSTIDATSVLGGTSSATSGSITSNASVNLGTYRYFSLGAKESCAPLLAFSGNTKTWNGSSWSPSAPTLYDKAIINAPFNGTLQCNALVLNSDINLTDNDYLEIVGSATGTGKVYMTSSAALVQRDPSATAPQIEIVKTTRQLRRYEYVHWGTPISGDFKNQMSTAKAQGYSLTGAFDNYYKWVAGATGSGYGWQILAKTETGKGFMARVKNQIPFTDTAFTGKIDVILSGQANNGSIDVPVYYNAACATCNSSYNLLANPYPSAIDAAKFLRYNTSVDGVIYIWSKSASGLNSQSDYAVWNLVGSVNTSPQAYSIDGKIPSGQGFMVAALGNNNVTFTNCMRITQDNNTFFRMSEDIPVISDKFKLNLYNDSEDVFSQILIAYSGESTMEYDRLYDAARNSVSSSQLYSILQNDGRKLAIDSRPDFFITDSVPLGITTENPSQTFTIALSEKQGVFLGGDVTVYLQDNQEGIVRNLSLAPYTFTLNDRQTNDRFKVIYQYTDGSLGNKETPLVITTATIKNGVLNIKATDNLKTVTVFDLAGRLIEQYTDLNSQELKENFNHEEAVYVAKITLSNGTTAGAKLINIK